MYIAAPGGCNDALVVADAVGVGSTRKGPTLAIGGHAPAVLIGSHKCIGGGGGHLGRSAKRRRVGDAFVGKPHWFKLDAEVLHCTGSVAATDAKDYLRRNGVCGCDS